MADNIMQKVILQGHIQVPEQDRQAVMEALVIHIELTRQEAGCLVFNVTADEDNKNRFNVYEEFESQAAFDHHQARVKASQWNDVTQNITRHYTVKTYES